MKHSPESLTLTAHGSRLTAHGSRLTAHGSRLTVECTIALACLAFSRLASAQYEAPSSDSSKHATIDRLYWDHVEGFCIADTIGK
ncbi:MAG TPA: hypothetical protein VFH95_05105, partial [Candidatus Kapabacteria bacterium]|nr:hypothetical protein [Candidatus Kapabacteria bacterium]